MAEKHRERGEYVPVGKRKPPAAATPLYVACPQCGAGPLELREDCLCHNGYVETGFTQERFDRLIKENDQLLVLLSDVSDAAQSMDIEVRRRLNKALDGRAADIEAARTRIKD